MPKNKIKTDDPERIRLMYRAALQEKMKRWNCTHPNKKKTNSLQRTSAPYNKSNSRFPHIQNRFPRSNT